MSDTDSHRNRKGSDVQVNKFGFPNGAGKEEAEGLKDVTAITRSTIMRNRQPSSSKGYPSTQGGQGKKASLPGILANPAAD